MMVSMKIGEVLERPAGEEVEEVLDAQRPRASHGVEVELERGNVDARDGQDRPEAIDHQDPDREEDPIAKFLDPEDIDKRIRHYFASSAFAP